MIFPKQGEFIFPIADGRIKTPGGDQELRTSTLIRPRPIQGESNIDFLGESEWSRPQPHDSLPDAGEAINDFWSMSGSFIYRYHVEPRVELYSPREESFPIPLKYIDVTRTTQEKRIDDYWNIDGSRDLSDPWTGFTRFTLLEEKPTNGKNVVRRESNEKTAYIQARSSMARALEVNGKARQGEGEAEVVWIPWNGTVFCETSKTFYRTGKLLVEGELKNHLVGQYFLVDRWLNIIRFPRKTTTDSKKMVKRSC